LPLPPLTSENVPKVVLNVRLHEVQFSLAVSEYTVETVIGDPEVTLNALPIPPPKWTVVGERANVKESAWSKPPPNVAQTPRISALLIFINELSPPRLS
jgi:hypothetical protein